LTKDKHTLFSKATLLRLPNSEHAHQFICEITINHPGFRHEHDELGSRHSWNQHKQMNCPNKPDETFSKQLQKQQLLDYNL
jgi:hypothetical protein